MSTVPESTPDVVVQMARVASAFVQFERAYKALEKDITTYGPELPSDHRAQVARWICSASAMVLKAQEAFDKAVEESK
jgi:hypothetical protein